MFKKSKILEKGKNNQNALKRAYVWEHPFSIDFRLFWVGFWASCWPPNQQKIDQEAYQNT